MQGCFCSDGLHSDSFAAEHIPANINIDPSSEQGPTSVHKLLRPSSWLCWGQQNDLLDEDGLLLKNWVQQQQAAEPGVTLCVSLGPHFGHGVASEFLP